MKRNTKKFCHVKQRKKRKKVFLFLFSYESTKNPAPSRTFLPHGQREKNLSWRRERFFFTRRRRTGRPSWTREELFIRRCSNKNAKEPSEERKEKSKKSCPIGYAYLQLYSYVVDVVSLISFISLKITNFVCVCVCVLNDDSFFSPLQIIIKYCTHTQGGVGDALQNPEIPFKFMRFSSVYMRGVLPAATKINKVWDDIHKTWREINRFVTILVYTK